MNSNEGIKEQIRVLGNMIVGIVAHAVTYNYFIATEVEKILEKIDEDVDVEVIKELLIRVMDYTHFSTKAVNDHGLEALMKVDEIIAKLS